MPPSHSEAATTDSGAHDHHHHHHRPLTGFYGLIAGLSMLGQGARLRVVLDLAALSPGDRVLDVGCGPGTAVRAAARLGATVTGVDPSPVMLRLARVSTRSRRGVTLLEGTAEALPLADDAVDVAWAIASAHHWDDPVAAFAELHRVLAPGGRLLVAERDVKEGAKGHGAHGASPATATRLVSQAEGAGFTGATQQIRGAGAHRLVVVTATNT